VRFKLLQINQRFMAVPRPIEMKSKDANFSGVNKIKLPVIAYVNELLWLNIHRLTHIKVEIGTLQLPTV